MSNWYNSVFRKIHYDMHTPATVPNVGAEFVPGRFAAALADAGYEAACIFTKCTYGWSYYPTRIGAVHPSCGRDLFGEACAALRAAGLKTIAYYALEVLPPPLVAANPDVLKRDGAGDPCVEAHDRTCGCIFGPMLNRIILPQLGEIVDHYPVDAVFLDGLPQAFWRPCHCAACREAFGAPLPRAQGDPQWPRFREWQMQQQRHFAEQVGVAVHAANPSVLVGINYLAAQPCSPIAPPPGIDFLTADVSVHGSCPLDTSYQLAAWTWRGMPCDAMDARMLGWWQDWTMRPPEALRVEAAIGISRGARLFMGDLIQPDTVQPHPAVLACQKEINRFVQARESLAASVEPVAEIAVVHDVGAEFRHGAAPDGNASRGAFLALLGYAQPLHVLYPADVCLETLCRYSMVLINSGAGLDVGAVAALSEYVAGGGSLFLCGPAAEFLALPGMDQLTGLENAADGEPLPMAYLELSGAFWEKRWPQPIEGALPPILIHGRPTLAHARGAEVLCRLTAPGALYQMGARPPGALTGWVGVSRNRVGRGRVVVCTVDLGRDFMARGNTFARDLLQVLARWSLGSKPRLVEVDSPARLEVNLARGENLLRIHLLHHSGAWRPGAPYLPDRVPPLHDVSLRLTLPAVPHSIRQYPGGLTLPWGIDPEGKAVLSLPPLNLHCCVEVRW